MPDGHHRRRRNHLPTFPDPTLTLSEDDLRNTAYEIFVASCRASSSRPLTFISSSGSGSSSDVAAAWSLQRSTTSEVVRKALGMKVKRRESGKGGSGESGSEAAEAEAEAAGMRKRRGIGVGEVVRVQMRVSEQTDSRVRRALLRIASGQIWHLEAESDP